MYPETIEQKNARLIKRSQAAIAKLGGAAHVAEGGEGDVGIATVGEQVDEVAGAVAGVTFCEEEADNSP